VKPRTSFFITSRKFFGCQPHNSLDQQLRGVGARIKREVIGVPPDLTWRLARTSLKQEQLMVWMKGVYRGVPGKGRNSEIYLKDIFRTRLLKGDPGPGGRKWA
jgi:hypothetical protein